MRASVSAGDSEKELPGRTTVHGLVIAVEGIPTNADCAHLVPVEEVMDVHADFYVRTVARFGNVVGRVCGHEPIVIPIDIVLIRKRLAEVLCTIDTCLD